MEAAALLLCSSLLLALYYAIFWDYKKPKVEEKEILKDEEIPKVKVFVVVSEDITLARELAKTNDRNLLILNVRHPSNSVREMCHFRLGDMTVFVTVVEDLFTVHRTTLNAIQ